MSAQHTPGPCISYVPRCGMWSGAVRDASGAVVWQCLHLHRNRDSGSVSRGPSAKECAQQACAAIAKAGGAS